MNEGQISENDDYVREIALILKSDTSISKIVEVGTYNGLGSTLVIPDHASLYTYENKRELYNDCKTRYENKHRVNVIYGRLSDMIMEKQDVVSNPMFNANVDDLNEYNIAPNVINTLPNTVDFVLLYGREFSTIGDWHVIKHKTPKYIGLNDCNVLKTYVIDMELMFDVKYQVHSRGKTGNGWVIYKRKNHLKENLNTIFINVTLGDALDRLTILDIKLERFVDENKIEMIKNNRDTLMSFITKHKDYDYDYRILKYINTQLYNAEEKVYNGSDNIEDYKIIKTWNTMRVNIKKYIETKTGSDIVEQKGYKKKVGFFFCHKGYGDVLILNGAIRYSIMKVDELYLVCHSLKIENLQLMFKDLHNLKFVSQDNFETFDTLYVQLQKENNDLVFFKSGTYKEVIPNKIINILVDFYEDLNIPRNIMFDFFHMPSNNPYLKPPEIDYIFVQTKSSSHDNKDIISWNINDILTIDSNCNLYKPTDPFFSIANNFINKPLPYYIDVLKNAKEIHVVDSCFACFTYCLKLKNVTYYERDKVLLSTIFQTQ